MSDCIFCRIVRKEIPAAILLEDPYAVVIPDRQPAAASHALVIAKVHYGTLADALRENRANAVETIVSMTALAERYAERLPGGHRIVVNSGADAGQTVRHLHMHVLGGERLKDL